MVSIFGLGFKEVIIIILIVLVISFIFFRRYFSALIYDYVVDAGFSFADNFIAGAGLIGLDIGDWIAAFIIFKKEKKITGGLFAGIVAWEATNFLPFSLIPVFGEVLEVIMGLVPSVFIGRVLFNKYGKAEKKERRLEEDVSIAEQLGIGVSKERKITIKMKKLIRKADPVDALKEADKPISRISSKLNRYVDGMISDTSNIIQSIVNQNIQAPQELVNLLQEGINEAGQLLQQAQSAEKKGDYKTAINSAMNAKNIIISAAQQFDSAFQEYQNQMQQEQLQPGYTQ